MVATNPLKLYRNEIDGTIPVVLTFENDSFAQKLGLGTKREIVRYVQSMFGKGLFNFSGSSDDFPVRCERNKSLFVDYCVSIQGNLFSIEISFKERIVSIDENFNVINGDYERLSSTKVYVKVDENELGVMCNVGASLCNLVARNY